jgi:hypothetical protein
MYKAAREVSLRCGISSLPDKTLVISLGGSDKWTRYVFIVLRAVRLALPDLRLAGAVVISLPVSPTSRRRP